jgi:hypothetical protein
VVDVIHIPLANVNISLLNNEIHVFMVVEILFNNMIADFCRSRAKPIIQDRGRLSKFLSCEFLD